MNAVKNAVDNFTPEPELVQCSDPSVDLRKAVVGSLAKPPKGTFLNESL